MKGDFTRDTFNPAKHFSRVLLQQGRVTLDADHNEQNAIILYYLRTLARDLIGPYAAPTGDAGFLLSYNHRLKDMVIGAGRYYVDGILVENDGICPYSQQPDYPLPADDPLVAEFNNPTGHVFWAYLDVWERHITSIEDDDIREKALNGPDTCTRAKVVWQVKVLPPGKLPANITPTRADAGSCAGPIDQLIAVSSALLAARVDPGRQTEDACITPPDSKYRGTENQLYRVEIHDSGTAGTATFKWSRDNGSIATAWLGTAGNDLQVLRSRGFVAGNWVELSDDTLDLLGLPGALVQLAKVQGDTLTVDPASVPSSSALAWSNLLVNPKVRRWDQTGNENTQLVHGAVPIREKASGTDFWIDLEDGLQIEFLPSGQYRTGDYWLIPARVATGNIEWPPFTDDSGTPVKDAAGNVIPDALPPDGIEHHYAPLGFFSLNGDSFTLGSCRCTFDPASSCFRTGSLAVGAHLVRPTNFDAKLLSEDAVEEAQAKSVVKRRKK